MSELAHDKSRIRKDHMITATCGKVAFSRISAGSLSTWHSLPATFSRFIRFNWQELHHFWYNHVTGKSWHLDTEEVTSPVPSKEHDFTPIIRQPCLHFAFFPEGNGTENANNHRSRL
jgi:hypothetical protein